MLQLLKNYLYCSNQQNHSFLSCKQGKQIKRNTFIQKQQFQTERSKNRSKKISLKMQSNKIKSERYLPQTSQIQNYSQNSPLSSFIPRIEKKIQNNSEYYRINSQTNSSNNKLSCFQACNCQSQKQALVFSRVQDPPAINNFVAEIPKQSQKQQFIKFSDIRLNNLSTMEQYSQSTNQKQQKSTQQFNSLDLTILSQRSDKSISGAFHLEKSPQLNKDLDVSLAISVQPGYKDEEQIPDVSNDQEGMMVFKKRTNLQAAQSYISHSSTQSEESFIIENQQGYLIEFRNFLSNQ